MCRGGKNVSHRLASRAGLLLVACCACALLSSSPLPTRRYFLTFGLASKVVVDGEAEKGNLDVSVQQDGRDNGDADSLDPIDGSPAAAVEAGGLAAVQQQGRSSRGSSVSYTVSTQRRASKSRYVLPAVLISALAAAGMMGYVTPKKTPAPEKTDVETVAARAGAEQFDSDATTEQKSAEIAQETEEPSRRRKQAALVAAVLVAAAVYGLRSSLLGVDKVSSPTALQGLLKKPESMHGIDPDASVDFQPDASVERQMEVPAEGAGDEVRGWQHLVRDFSAMLAGEYALSPRVGAVASAVALGLLAFSLAAARRASRRRQQQGEERPASPTAGEEQADPVPAEAAAPAAEPEQIPEAEPEKPKEEEVPPVAAPADMPEEVPEERKQEEAGGEALGEDRGEPTKERGPASEDEFEAEEGPEQEIVVVAVPPLPPRPRTKLETLWEDGEDGEASDEEKLANIKTAVRNSVRRWKNQIEIYRTQAKKLDAEFKSTSTRLDEVKLTRQPIVQRKLETKLEQLSQTLADQYELTLVISALQRISLSLLHVVEDAATVTGDHGRIAQFRISASASLASILVSLEKVRLEALEAQEGRGEVQAGGASLGLASSALRSIDLIKHQSKKLLLLVSLLGAEPKTGAPPKTEPKVDNMLEAQAAELRSELSKTEEASALREQEAALLAALESSLRRAQAFFAKEAKVAAEFLLQFGSATLPGAAATLTELQDDLRLRRIRVTNVESERKAVRGLKSTIIEKQTALEKKRKELTSALEEVEKNIKGE
ncbi:hypothetical protein NCLIV_012010 [Neospora caninum Liverpool]|uniref:Uncharacterized protein n=1 Tax=Neospora caninum (strain Liverpool) TaxID=572307 RepID=F0V9X2_NEOCL|nr:hypothetical protein NCLIV_012010 [Neospora caninum Liverpool]CBZ50734.1 hypothetical protein NCLIV_012010 [Neospora caninum Liverpool]CEL65346.1 TPA: hypothetical protein BN1204_012010 [Neospora caninum Liverpool]|eukprot:XP_003880767.1 hypothetical protein NCLIV_012010 [Neospora caninum Liverpool]